MAITIIDVDSEDEINGSNNQEEPTVVNRQERSDEDNLLGKMVHSESEAFELYNSYAIRLGFSVRRGKKRKDAKNAVRKINFLCSKQGFPEDDDPSETKKADKLSTRTGCQAMIRFTKTDDMWTVSDFHPEHNHKFAKPEERQYLRSNKNLSEAHKGVIKTMKDARIGTVKAYSYLAEEVGGSQNVGFTKRDCYNFVNKEKMAMFEAGDAQSLINLFKRKQTEDPMFFYSVQVDQENRMTNFFWRDGRSRLDYECFGDVVVFDTTYRTNRYNMICAPFVGISNHWKNVLFGCAFLLDETTTSFKWLFETFLESMGNQPPRTIYTDQCPAMANGIRDVFPDTCHRLCLWHISLNATRNIASYLGIPDFKKMFNKCLYACETVEEFQSKWDELLVTFNVTENSWLKKLYTLREKWCAAFSLDTFSAGIQSSQRSESTNRVFHHISAARMRLIEFVHHYDKQLEATRSSDLEETFRCTNGVPSSAKRSTKLLYHAGEVYSRKVYNLFGTELAASMAFKMVEVDTNETVHTFELSREGRNIIYVVKVNSSNDTITCSCKKFESKGLLCRHALRVLNVRNVTKIPPQYILKRWEKDAKSEIGAQEHEALLQQKDKPSIALRRNNMIRKAYDILSTAALTEKGCKIAMEKLKEMKELIEKDEAESNGSGNKENNEALNDDSISDDNESDHQVDNTPILDPPCAKTKGMSNERWKSTVEKRNKNASKNTVSSSKKGDSEKQQKGRSSSKKGDSELAASKKVCTRSSTINVHPCLPPSNEVLNTYSAYHAQYNSSNPYPIPMSTQFHPTMNLSAINTPVCLPPPNQIPYDSTSFNSLNVLRSTSKTDQTGADSMAFYRPNSSFTSMLLGQHTSGSTSASNHQVGLYPQPSQGLHSMSKQQQQGSRDMPYYLQQQSSIDMPYYLQQQGSRDMP